MRGVATAWFGPDDRGVSHRIHYGTVDDIREHGMSLLAAHRQELDGVKMPVDPEWTSYYALEEAGALLTLCVWRIEEDRPRELVGYSVTFLRPHLHSRRTRMAQVDLIYLLPSLRATALGGMLITDTEAAAREKGAGVVVWHAAPRSQLDRTMRRGRRYAHVENVYMKEI